jgi:hypothetical protein
MKQRVLHWQYITVLYSHWVRCSAVQCSAVQCSAVQCSAVQCSAVQCSAVQCKMVRCKQVTPASRAWAHLFASVRPLMHCDEMHIGSICYT